MLCKERNITIESLMSECELTRETFSKWSARKTVPRCDTLLRMSKALGVSMEFLLTGNEDRPATIAELVYEYMNENMPGTLDDILVKIQKKVGNSGTKVS